MSGRWWRRAEVMVQPWGGVMTAELTISGAFHGLCSFARIRLSRIAKASEHIERIRERHGISKRPPVPLRRAFVHDNLVRIGV